MLAQPSSNVDNNVKYYIMQPIEQPPSITHRQPEMCRKRSAFRQKIRKEYIDSLIRKRRIQLQQQEANDHDSPPCGSKQEDHKTNDNIKEMSSYKIQQSLVNSGNQQGQIKYPLFSGRIPAVQLFGSSQNGNSKYTVRSFSSYQHFAQYLDQTIELMPDAVYSLTNLLSNRPQLTTQFIRFLFGQTNDPRHLPKLDRLKQKFRECTVSQFANYMYILESLLISLKGCTEYRMELVKQTMQQITNKTFSFCKHNKMERQDIIKRYFDYLVILGDDIRVLTNLQAVMMMDYVKDVFGIYYTGNEGDRCEDLYDSTILVCNTVMSLGNHLLTGQPNNSTIMLLDKQYQSELLKDLLTSELLKSPPTLHKMLLVGMEAQTDQQMEHMLRFFINFTYTISTPQSMEILIHPLTIFVQSVLAQHKVMGRLSMINILVLRLVNNVTVNDAYSAHHMWKEGVITKIVEIYGFWILQGLGVLADEKHEEGLGGKKNHQCEQPQMRVYSQFLWFITTFILLLSNEAPVTLSDTFCLNLNELIDQKFIHIIILQSLTLPYIATGDPELIAKCLESLLVLANCDPTLTHSEGGHTWNSVRGRMVGYRELLDNMALHLRNQEVENLCEELLEMIKAQEDDTNYGKDIRTWVKSIKEVRQSPHQDSKEQNHAS